MTSAPLRLTAEDKLDVLRKLDPAGEWQSLDDQRYCTRCDHVISGRQIEVAGGTRAHGPVRLECPTEGCLATPHDWTSPRGRSGSRATGDASSHKLGTVHIKADAEGISISHNGRAAVVRRTRTGRVVPLGEITGTRPLPRQRRGLMTWLTRKAASFTVDGSRLLGVLRRARRDQFQPVH